ncbi:MAG: hypothetical protein COA43_09795 [Robiginitomaculum sp.]|nr:MAG: hypothetical protein COA43_09795 [Robiginitomaculum sp.]
MKFTTILPLIVCSLGLYMPAHAASMKVHTPQTSTHINVENGVNVYRFGPTPSQQHAQRIHAQTAARQAQQDALANTRRIAQQQATQSAYKNGFADGYKQGKVESTQPRRRRQRRSRYGRRYSTSFALPRFRYGSYGRTIASGRYYRGGY